MIVVTRLNNSQFAINPDLIERIHASPDTTLVMVDGAKFIVTETLDDVIEKIARFRAHVISLAYLTPDADYRPGIRSLEIVEGPHAIEEIIEPGSTVPARPRRL
ncbi:flagellar protein FlbD [Cryobacterium sp. TMT1-62]|uniref:flagellar FlbD family protein n=1 Tax=unclassified Cryobacterium TaxID=2649013 RepID=UPI000CE3B26A|nr:MULTISPECIES: flagellar FlbD family protein [unclassified Cryobacterium]TFB59489.1 flagellar protein FlbD [Cryobacterium sp. Hz7]TFB60506.1 flagellar protein FlbD [Cryobacterium sp. Sr3]TFC38883.1 flagellar protein FlbD [Cryobacterium sp. TMT2-14]TFD30048.1 flagellar protein FlbD [Cryobacterium sp. TMT1-62]TFD35575.1 flagellar protein FlbD [Cryobacterium sp. TMT1-19]